MSSSPVYIVTLAAGEARRFGSPKQLASLHGRTLLDRAGAQVAELSAMISARQIETRSILVLGANAELIKQSCSSAHLWDLTVHCPNWESGMWQSIASAFHAIAEDSANVSGSLVQLLDQPNICSESLLELVTSGLEENKMVCAQYPNSVGVPAFFPALEMNEFLNRRHSGKGGAKSFILSRPYNAMQIEGVLDDIDTPADLAALSAKFDSGLKRN